MWGSNTCQLGHESNALPTELPIPRGKKWLTQYNIFRYAAHKSSKANLYYLSEEVFLVGSKQDFFHFTQIFISWISLFLIFTWHQIYGNTLHWLICYSLFLIHFRPQFKCNETSNQIYTYIISLTWLALRRNFHGDIYFCGQSQRFCSPWDLRKISEIPWMIQWNRA